VEYNLGRKDMLGYQELALNGWGGSGILKIENRSLK
jgi:hypothetical protein